MSELYDLKYFRGSKKFQTDRARLLRITDEIEALNPVNVLDVGCGPGYLVRLLNSSGIPAWGVDNAEILVKNYWNNEPEFTLASAEKLPFPTLTFDLVTSFDFFEHIPEDKIEAVYDEMQRVGSRFLFEITMGTDEFLTEKQKRYHVTNHPMAWWKKKLPGAILRNSWRNGI